MDSQDLAQLARLNSLVPSVGTFFTRLPLERAFLIQDSKRAISARRLVAPSFNDIRLILNTAQALSLAENSKDDPSKRLKLVTFDGDVTLVCIIFREEKNTMLTKHIFVLVISMTMEVRFAKMILLLHV